MITTLGKSTYSRITRTSIEKSKEQEELDKLNDVLVKLKQDIYSQERNFNSPLNRFSSVKRSRSNGITKSNLLKASSSKVKEDKSFKEFLCNYMYMDDNLSISPQNMHLLTDDDTNQSISSKQKFKNLANLMMDDKETVVEKSFDHNEEERIILQLYTALSKKSKELFVENDSKKLEKLQLFFKRINKIKMPEINLITNTNSNNNLDSENSKESLNEKEFTSFFKSDLPMITANFLSNINHNIINIEDIYNSHIKKSMKKNEEINIIPIKANEIITNDSMTKSFNDHLDSKRSGVNLFSEFSNSCPRQEFIDLERDINSIEKFEKHKKLQEKFFNKIISISELDESYFPKGNYNLNDKTIFRFAKNNKEAVEERTDSFSIYSYLLTDIQTVFLNNNKNNNCENKNEKNNNENNNRNNIDNHSINESSNSNKSLELMIEDDEEKEIIINEVKESRRASIINNLLFLKENSSESESSNFNDTMNKKRKSSDDVFTRFLNINN